MEGACLDAAEDAFVGDRDVVVAEEDVEASGLEVAVHELFPDVRRAIIQQHLARASEPPLKLGRPV